MTMNILVSPDSFKESATARDVAIGISEGWASMRPSDPVRLLPFADGGEGTLEAFALSDKNARRVPVVTKESRAGKQPAWLLLSDGTGVVELACSTGFDVLGAGRAPLDAHTVAFGEAIAAALDYGVERLLLAVGGSKSTDGGAGALTALGARFLDAAGNQIGLGNRHLAEAASVDVSGLRPLPEGGALVLADVTNPLLGASGAARVFGPQKGASSYDVIEMERNLSALAGLFSVEAGSPGTGAAGGTAFGMLAWGATITSGVEVIANALGISEAVSQADVVITGEGRFDEQSFNGKVSGYISSLACAAHTRVMLVAGQIDVSTKSMFDAAVSLNAPSGDPRATIDNPLPYLRSAGSYLAGWLNQHGTLV